MNKINFFLITKLPVSPYFSQIYVTLSSIIAGVVLGTLFIYSFSDVSSFSNLLLDWKVFIVFVLTMLIWHHYVTHNQFVAWHFDLLDTFVPFGFIFFLIMLVVTIKNNGNLFFVFLTFVSFGAWFAYVSSLNKLKKNKHLILEIYKEIIDYNFARDLYMVIVNFNIKMIKHFLLISIVNIGLLIFIYLSKNKVEIYKILFLFFYSLGLIRIALLNLINDIENFLNEEPKS